MKRELLHDTSQGYRDYHGYTARAALDDFIDYYNTQVSNGNLNIIEIQHGWGSTGAGGRAISGRLRKFLSRFPDKVLFETGEYNGDPYDSTTYVFPKHVLPTREDLLAEQVIDYCSPPKTEKKIMHKFHRYGEAAVYLVLLDLVADGTLQTVYKGKYKLYAQATHEKQPSASVHIT
jgi:hypothetical protein